MNARAGVVERLGIGAGIGGGHRRVGALAVDAGADVVEAVAERHLVAGEVHQLPAGAARVAAVLGGAERGLGDERRERVAEVAVEPGEQLRQRRRAASASTGVLPAAPCACAIACLTSRAARRWGRGRRRWARRRRRRSSRRGAGARRARRRGRAAPPGRTRSPAGRRRRAVIVGEGRAPGVGAAEEDRAGSWPSNAVKSVSMYSTAPSAAPPAVSSGGRMASASAASVRRSAGLNKLLDEPQPGGSKRTTVPAPTHWRNSRRFGSPTGRHLITARARWKPRGRGRHRSERLAQAGADLERRARRRRLSRGLRRRRGRRWWARRAA